MLQSILPGGLHGLVMVIQWTVAGLALGVLLWRGPINLSRRQALYFGVAWVVLITIEYWGLGPWSAMTIEDEGDIAIPLYVFLDRHYEGTRLIHGWGMDQDVFSMTDSAMAYVSLERLLFGTLPPWGAMAAHKLSVAGVGFTGAYLLARRGAGASREAAWALAAWYTIATPYSLSITLLHGVGYALPALAVYLVVFRIDKPNYILGVVCLAAVHAASSSIAHSVLAVGAGVLVCWLVANPVRPARFLAACAILFVCLAANWAEVIHALMVNGPGSYRGAEFDFASDRDAVDTFLAVLRNLTPTKFVIVAGLLVLAIGRSRFLFKAAVIVALFYGLAELFYALPWTALGLSMLNAFDFGYLTFGLSAATVLIGAWAAGTGGAAHPVTIRRTGTVSALAVAVALGAMAGAKTFNGAQLLGRGGLSHFTEYANLAEPAWAPADRLFRVATVPYRITPNVTAAYGFETVDTLLNVVDKRYGLFFQNSFPDGTSIPHFYLTNHNAADFLCCSEYSLAKLADLDLLRLTNTEFVVSVLPLTGSGLTLVSGPEDGSVPPRRGDSLADKVRRFAGLTVNPSAPYVYRLSRTVPRAYFATSVQRRNLSRPEAATYRMIAGAALAGDAVLAPSAPDEFSNTGASSKILSHAKAPDGYRVTVASETGGVLIVNTVWNRFWSATFNGRALAVAPANGIHTAIALPPGSGTVRLVYNRPTAAARLAAYFEPS